MKRVCNENTFKPEKVNNRDIKIYSNGKGMSKDYESYTKIKKIRTKEVKNM